MGWIFFVIAAIFFFLSGVGSTVIPNAVSWGLFSLALGLVLGGSFPYTWARRPPG